MSYDAPPAMLLDFDGVINAWGPYADVYGRGKRNYNPMWDYKMNRGVAVCNGRDFTIKWAAPLVRRLVELHESGLAEIRWCSTWNSDAVNIERLLGLPHWPVAFEAAGLHWTKIAQLKRRAAAHVQDVERRRLVWVDDNEVPHHWELVHAAMTQDGSALLVRPKEPLGLLPHHMDQIDAFCGRVAAPELLHIRQIGSQLNICNAPGGLGSHPGKTTCPDCDRIFKEAYT